MTDTGDALLARATRAGGAALAGVIRGFAAVRPAAKPLHPQGTLERATVRRWGLRSPVGVPWLDEAGADDVLTRWSRAVGLPAPLPDIHGLALRVPHPGGHGDLLFATTGWAPVTRLLLLPGRSERRPMTTLLPYSTPTGRVVLGARPEPGGRVLLCAAPMGGRWDEFGELLPAELSSAADPTVSFDPVLNQLPGLRYEEWVARLREPSYRRARQSRD